MRRITSWALLLFLICLPALVRAEPAPAKKQLSDEERNELVDLRKRYAATGGSADEQAKVVDRAIELGPMGIDRVAPLAKAEAKKAFEDYSKAFAAQASKLKEADAATVVDSELRVLVLRARLLKLSKIVVKLEEAAGEKGYDPEAKLREMEEGYLRQMKLGPIYSQLDDAEIKAIEETNKRRVENGLPALEVDLKLVLTARDHSKDMAEQGFFAHESPVEGKKTFVDRAKRFDAAANGENIFMGSPSGEAAVEGWMNSPPHRENILRDSFRRIGIGRYNGHWTQLFGN